MTTRRAGSRVVATAVLAAMLSLPAPATADITAFLGTTVGSGTRLARGVAAGTGLVIVGFELEGAQIAEDLAKGEPGLTTGAINVLLQTPLEVSRTQFYATSGVGVYRERLGTRRETNALATLGGGVKIRLSGPLKVRLDYRLLRLRGAPVRDVVHRLYAGATLGF